MKTLHIEILAVVEPPVADDAGQSVVSVMNDNPYITHRTGENIPISTFPYRIGRHPTWANLVVDEINVSGKHGEIVEQSDTGNFYYADHSTNGSGVGDARVHNNSILLKDGDVICIPQITPRLKFRVHINSNDGATLTEVDMQATQHG